MTSYDTITKSDYNLKTNEVQLTYNRPVTWDSTQLVEWLAQNPQLWGAISKSVSATLIIMQRKSTFSQKSDDGKYDEVLYATENCFSDSTKTVLILWALATNPC